MMEQRLNQVTRDRVSAFATISSIISTRHPGPLPNLAASSHFAVTHDDSVPSTDHVNVHEENITTSQPKSIVVGQQDEPSEG